jgi:hypothetical protein
MKITVVFPKASCYYGKSLDTQRIYSALFKKYLDMLAECNCQVEYLLEDDLAMDFMKDYTFANARIVTCVSPSDIKFFDNYRDLIDLNSRVYQAYNSTENYAGEFEKQYTVPITLIREDREAYIDKRVEVYRKRLRLATDAMLKSRKAVLMFRADNGLDKATALRDTVVNGDGRLCIEVNINSNMAVTYYGGTFLQEEYLPTILSM